MNALVTLADVLVTDARPEAKDNPFRVLLAPLASSPNKDIATTTTAAAWQGKDEGISNSSTSAVKRAGGSSSSGGIGVGKGGDGVERAPLIAVTAKQDGDGGALDAEVKLASFAFNVMIDAIKDSLVVLLEVNVALLNMIGATAGSGSGNRKTPAGDGGSQEAGGIVGLGSLRVLGALDEEEEPRSEVRENISTKMYVEQNMLCFFYIYIGLPKVVPRLINTVGMPPRTFRQP